MLFIFTCVVVVSEVSSRFGLLSRSPPLSLLDVLLTTIRGSKT
jgi:hypothetical protein